MKDEKKAKAKDEGRMVLFIPHPLRVSVHPCSAASIAFNIALALFTVS
jgi:hypothetical protein